MTQFVRVPPDSSGKRVTHHAFIEVPYNNKTQDFVVGNVITTPAGFSGVVTSVAVATSTTGTVTMLLADGSIETVTSADALQRNASTIATASATVTPYYVNHSVLVGGNNPKYPQHVDNRGAASVRFAEGAPAFDAFGQIKISDSNMIGVYEFANDPMTDLHAEETASGGTITHDAGKSLMDLSVTTGNGSSAIRTTNKYHFYWPAVGTEAWATIALNNVGTAGNTRRWGYFDEDNGVFFELAGTTLNVVLRSKVSGSVVETRVAQANWNVDRLDGSGLSGTTIDVSKLNIYWIDFQWLGGGRVRLGVMRDDGVRTTCHEFRNAGQNSYPYMQTGSLPWRVENFNTALTGTACTLRHVCTAIRATGKIDYTYWRFAHVHPQRTVSASNQPLMSVRSKLTVGGIKNVVNVYPEHYMCYVTGTGALRLDFCWPLTLTGETFAVDDGTTVDFDHAATAGTVDAEYWLVHSVYLTPGTHKIDLTEFFNENDEGILRGAGTTPAQVPFTIAATLISGSPVIDGVLTYRELR